MQPALIGPGETATGCNLPPRAEKLRIYIVMVIGSQFSRIMLHAVLATTLVTVYIPMMFTDAMFHPCRLAHHGWREECRRRPIDVDGLDIFATVVNLVGFALGGYFASWELSRSTTPWFRSWAETFRTGFLAAFMSFPYIVQHAAHISVRKESVWLGIFYLLGIGVGGVFCWLLGWYVGTGFGRKYGVENNAAVFRDESPQDKSQILKQPLFKKHHRGTSAVTSNLSSSSTAPSTSMASPSPSTQRISGQHNLDEGGKEGSSKYLSLKEGSLLFGFVIITYALFQERYTPIDALDPDFVKYHLLSIPLGTELILNASFSILGVAVSSLIPWHRENLVESCMDLLLNVGTCCCSVFHRNHSASSSSTPLLSHNRTSITKGTMKATYSTDLQRAKGCLLANGVSFAFIIGAYLSAFRHPTLFDSPIFVAYVSSFTGTLSNLEGMVSYSMALLRQKQHVDTLTVFLSNAIMAIGAMLLIRIAMIFSESTQPISTREDTEQTVAFKWNT